MYGWLGRLDRNRSLRHFKEKFAPRWGARYLAMPDPTALPAVLTALARVHLPALAPISALLTILRRSLRKPASSADRPRPGSSA